MPRSATKSQADKRKRRTSIHVTTPPMQDLKEEGIIRSHLTRAQWIDMLNQEDADEIVGEIMEEFMSEVMEGCLKVDVKRQLAHYSASWVLSSLTQTLERQFLFLAEGEGAEELSNTEDSEPMPATPDPWARGSEVDIGQIPVQTEPTVNQQCNVAAQTNSSPKQPEKETSPSSPKQSEKETSPRRPVRDKHYKVLSPRPSPQVDPKKNQRINLPKPVRNKSLPTLSCSAERKEVEEEGKKRRHSELTRSSYQLKKDSKVIPKLDPSCLPRHHIIPSYEILNNSYTKPNSKKPVRLPKLEQRYNKQQTELAVTSQKPLTTLKDQPRKVNRKTEEDVWLKKPSPSRKEGMVSSGPLRLDTMQMAKGVSLMVPQAVDVNSFIFNPPALSTKLKPIRSDVTVPLLSVEQVTAGPPPKVTPLFQTKN
ncbi:uncharacterized protein C2orf81 homolog [Pagrus major]|uniref:uncharacterized protein C2orf81 homolog n=1 Tax=Pagrus major TaxID=143350 RepID=UPI003CC87979